MTDNDFMEVAMLRTYNDMLRFFDKDRRDLEVRYHLKKHQTLMCTSREYERYCLKKAVRYCRAVRR